MRRKYSQIFLTNLRIAHKICNEVFKTIPTGAIVEIGPGKGILTQFLFPVYKNNYIGIEIDKKMVEFVKKRFDGIRIIHADFLKLSPDEINYPNFCGNLPYHISTRILKKVITLENFKSAVFMFQKEVAKKITAKPQDKEYGYISALVNIICETQYLFDVKRVNFSPIPEVDSAVIRLVSKQEKIARNEYGDYERFISIAFMHKRKTLANSIMISLNTKREIIYSAFNEIGLPINIRAEDVSPEMLLLLCKVLKKRAMGIEPTS